LVVRFSGKTALITGAASGIGRAAALALAAEGANVALNDVDAASLPSSEIGVARCSEHVADVSDPTLVERMVSEIEDRWGHLDVVLANAGINRDGFVGQLSNDDWDDVVRVNLSGVFFVCRAAFPKLSDGASVVMTSSVSVLGNRGQANYAASKAGLLGLARTLALEGASRSIRVNAVAPGFTDTPMVRGVPDKVRDKLIERVPLGRMAAPEEIARAMLFLASEEASYITGQVLFVDGGVSVGL
jgi:3-oxoacyl-[acyl-carrier protein] reductase